MKQIFTFSILCCYIAIISGCAKPLITNTHKGKYEYSSITDKNLLPIESSIGVVPAPATSPETKGEIVKTIFDFDTATRKTLLGIYAKNAKNNSEIVELIKTPLSNKAKPEPAKLQTDFSKIPVRLFLSNTKIYNRREEYVHPNTRLAYLNTQVCIDPTSPLVIYSIDRLENELDAVDMGTLNRTQNVKFGMEANSEYQVANSTSKNTQGNTDQTTNTKNTYDSLGHVTSSIVNDRNGTNTNEKTSGNGLKITGKASYDNSTEIKEAMNLKLKRIKTGFSFNSHNLTVSQQGFPLNDISDNTIVTVTLMLDNRNANLVAAANVQTFEGTLWSANGTPVKADNVAFRTRNISYIKKNSGNVSFTLSGKFEGLLRAVKNTKQSNTLEYDDQVHDYNFSGHMEAITVELNQYAKRIYWVIFKSPAGVFDLYINSATALNKPVLFFEGDNYIEYLFWLNKLVKSGDISLLKTNSKELFLRKRPGCNNCPDQINIVGNVSVKDLNVLKTQVKVENGYFDIEEVK